MFFRNSVRNQDVLGHLETVRPSIMRNHCEGRLLVDEDGKTKKNNNYNNIRGKTGKITLVRGAPAGEDIMVLRDWRGLPGIRVSHYYYNNRYG